MISHGKIGKEIYKRRKADPFELQCHDCCAGSDNSYNPRCDMEGYPKCMGEIIWCECIDDKELKKRNLFFIES